MIVALKGGGSIYTVNNTVAPAFVEGRDTDRWRSLNKLRFTTIRIETVDEDPTADLANKEI